MTIKNPHIIHFVRKRKDGYFEGEDRYICIGACGTTKEKSTRRKNKVTCQNCLRELQKEERN